MEPTVTSTLGLNFYTFLLTCVYIFVLLVPVSMVYPTLRKDYVFLSVVQSNGVRRWMSDIPFIFSHVRM